MAKLVDAPGSGPGGGNTVEVRVLSWAPKKFKVKHFKFHKAAKPIGYAAFLLPIADVNEKRKNSITGNVLHSQCPISPSGVQRAQRGLQQMPAGL